MHLALAPRRRLAAVYGPDAPAILAALDVALAARAAAGIPSRAYDPEEGLPELGVPPAPLEAPALVAQIGAAAEALALRGGIIESLWIVGGPQLVPFATLPNPMRDRDGPLHGDAPYGLAESTAPLARWPVGRTPDGDPPVAGLLVTQLRQVAAAHAAAPLQQRSALAVTAARWAAVTAELLAGLPPTTVQLAPPLRAGPVAAEAVARAGLLLCNLHGVRDRDGWYGQPAGDSELTPALHPADLAATTLDGAVVITQACFGARLAAVDETPTMATALLAAGAYGLYGALGLTYGAPDPPPGESDLLARALLQALQRPGARLGTALVQAIEATLREALRRQGAPDADELKTLLSFQLYGDPMVRVS